MPLFIGTITTKYIKLHRWEPILRLSELLTENLSFIKKSYQLLSSPSPRPFQAEHFRPKSCCNKDGLRIKGKLYVKIRSCDKTLIESLDVPKIPTSMYKVKKQAGVSSSSAELVLSLVVFTEVFISAIITNSLKLFVVKLQA